MTFFKNLLSYLFDVTLEKTKGSYKQQSIKLALSKGRLKLMANSAIYSFDDLYLNFVQAFDYYKIKDKSIENTLILGFGMGSIAYILEKKYAIKTQITGIEVDESIALLAEKYSLPRLKNAINLVTDRAENYVAITETKYNLVCIDVFEDDKIPNIILSTNFLLDVKNNVLACKYVIFFNFLARTPEEIKFAETYLDTIFKPLFPKAYLRLFGGNIMLISENW
jgi:hypothetical protein